MDLQLDSNIGSTAHLELEARRDAVMGAIRANLDLVDVEIAHFEGDWSFGELKDFIEGDLHRIRQLRGNLSGLLEKLEGASDKGNLNLGQLKKVENEYRKLVEKAANIDFEVEKFAAQVAFYGIQTIVSVHPMGRAIKAVTGRLVSAGKVIAALTSRQLMLAGCRGVFYGTSLGTSMSLAADVYNSESNLSAIDIIRQNFYLRAYESFQMAFANNLAMATSITCGGPLFTYFSKLFDHLEMSGFVSMYLRDRGSQMLLQYFNTSGTQMMQGGLGAIAGGIVAETSTTTMNSALGFEQRCLEEILWHALVTSCTSFVGGGAGVLGQTGSSMRQFQYDTINSLSITYADEYLKNGEVTSEAFAQALSGTALNLNIGRNTADLNRNDRNIDEGSIDYDSFCLNPMNFGFSSFPSLVTPEGVELAGPDIMKSESDGGNGPDDPKGSSQSKEEPINTEKPDKPKITTRLLGWLGGAGKENKKPETDEVEIDVTELPEDGITDGDDTPSDLVDTPNAYSAQIAEFKKYQKTILATTTINLPRKTQNGDPIWKPNRRKVIDTISMHKDNPVTCYKIASHFLKQALSVLEQVAKGEADAYKKILITRDAIREAIIYNRKHIQEIERAIEANIINDSSKVKSTQFIDNLIHNTHGLVRHSEEGAIFSMTLTVVAIYIQMVEVRSLVPVIRDDRSIVEKLKSIGRESDENSIKEQLLLLISEKGKTQAIKNSNKLINALLSPVETKDGPEISRISAIHDYTLLMEAYDMTDRLRQIIAKDRDRLEHNASNDPALRDTLKCMNVVAQFLLQRMRTLSISKSNQPLVFNIAIKRTSRAIDSTLNKIKSRQ